MFYSTYSTWFYQQWSTCLLSDSLLVKWLRNLCLSVLLGVDDSIGNSVISTFNCHSEISGAIFLLNKHKDMSRLTQASLLLHWCHKPWPWATFSNKQSLLYDWTKCSLFAVYVRVRACVYRSKEEKKKPENEESALSCVCKQDKHNQHLESHIWLWSSWAWNLIEGPGRLHCFLRVVL